MKNAALLTVIMLTWASVAAGSSEHVIRQKGRTFSESEIGIKTGETVVFANDDTVPHNVISTSAGNEFNLGSQVPGTATPVTFTASGEVSVLCGIHPRMRMTIKVSD
ncbi:MAG TPA: plastocyanin/azurin family copper-binding protein [Xanthobacteraceae bacterium]